MEGTRTGGRALGVVGSRDASLSEEESPSEDELDAARRLRLRLRFLVGVGLGGAMARAASRRGWAAQRRDVRNKTITNSANKFNRRLSDLSLDRILISSRFLALIIIAVRRRMDKVVGILGAVSCLPVHDASSHAHIAEQSFSTTMNVV